MSYNNTLLL